MPSIGYRVDAFGRQALWHLALTPGPVGRTWLTNLFCVETPVKPSVSESYLANRPTGFGAVTGSVLSASSAV